MVCINVNDGFDGFIDNVIPILNQINDKSGFSRKRRLWKKKKYAYVNAFVVWF